MQLSKPIGSQQVLQFGFERGNGVERRGNAGLALVCQDDPLRAPVVGIGPANGC